MFDERSGSEDSGREPERERIGKGLAKRKIIAALKEWLGPLGFEKTGRNSECSFDRWQGDLHQHIGVEALDYNFVGLRPAGVAGFVSAERVFQHFRDGPLTGDEGGFAFAFRVHYEQLTRDPYKSYIVWTYADEEADVMAQLRHAVMEFIYAKMEPIKTPDDLIELQIRMLDSDEMFAIGRTLACDDALRLLTLIRLHRTALYSDLRLMLQPILDKWTGGPCEGQMRRHLAYLDHPGELPPLPGRSAWAEWPAT